MQVRALHKNARISAQKVRLVSRQLKGLSVAKVTQVLTFHEKKAAGLIHKVVKSAIANAEHNQGADIDDLYVKNVVVNVASRMKRFRARAKGRGARILKPLCHIEVVLTDGIEG